MKIAISGFGRIGRAIFRLAVEDGHDLALINDLNPSSENIAYLANYDTIYGPISPSLRMFHESNSLLRTQSNLSIRLQHLESPAELAVDGIDVLFDCSGRSDNGESLHALAEKYPELQIIVTHDHPDAMMLSSEDLRRGSLVRSPARIYSAGTCDGNAIAPVLEAVSALYGPISSGMVVTAHPWLSYQNVTDGPSVSWASAGGVYEEFALGRSVQNNVIPKSTTAVDVAKKIAKRPNLDIESFSYRVPTTIVSSAVCEFRFETPVTDSNPGQFHQLLEQFGLGLSVEQLVSSDYIGRKEPAVVDCRWTRLAEGRVSVVLFYDNEVGYAASALHYAESLVV